MQAPGLIRVWCFLLATLVAGLAWAGDPGAAPKRASTRYGSYHARQMQRGSRRICLVRHLDAGGKKIGLSWSVFDAKGLLAGEGVKLEGTLGASSAKLAAQIYATQLRLTRNPRRMPVATAVALDVKTLKMYFDRSGNKRLKNPSPPLRELMPVPSLERWRVDNCAEFRVANTALKGGAKLDDLVIHTVRTATGESYKRCANCKVTTASATVTSD